MSPRARAPHFLLLAGVLTIAAAAQTPFQRTGENVPFGPWAISAAADLDGDGDLDVAGPGVLLLNDGNGVFSLPPAGTVAPVTNSWSSSLALGDIDGDGDVDALSDVLGYAWLNDGSGNFSLSPMLPPPVPQAVTKTSLPILGDVDGDGDLDAFLLTSKAGPIFTPAGPPLLWLNNGAGVFTDASTQVPATVAIQGAGQGFVEFFDYDLDGDLDILAADLNGRLLLVNDGLGVFSASAALGSGSTQGAGIADVDGNGRPDVLFHVGLSDEIWLNTSSGWLLVSHPATTGLVEGFLAVDVDGDGDDEVVRQGLQGPSHLQDYVPGSGLGASLQSWLGGPLAPLRRRISADLDGDGDRDVMLELCGRHRVLHNTRQSSLVEAFGDWPSEIAIIGLAGDVDGDNDLDLVGVPPDDAGDNHLWQVLNDGFGGFSPAAVGGDTLPGLTVPHLVDLDGDGDLDIYAAIGSYYGYSGNTAIDRILVNADAGWTLSPTLIPGTGETFTVKSGDLDGDGHQDIVLARRSPATIVTPPLPSLVVRNLGGLTFAPPVPLGPALQSFDLALGDVDADGDLDVLEANDQWGGTSGTCLLHRNDGTGSFAVDPLFPGVAARAVALADLDGDADLDAIQGTSVLLNDGTGIFTFFTSISITHAWEPMRAMTLADTDLDGDLDIVDGAGRYMTNLGNGSFAASVPLPSGLVYPPWNLAVLPFPLADFDADGDPDLVVRGHLFHNVTRHLARRGLPGPGRTVHLDLWGPPTQPFHLFAAAGPGNTPVPPLGTAYLDLATLVHVTFGNLDSTGTASLPLAVPPNPSLIGFTLHWQAAVGNAPGLTNRVLTTAVKL